MKYLTFFNGEFVYESRNLDDSLFKIQLRLNDYMSEDFLPITIVEE